MNHFIELIHINDLNIAPSLKQKFKSETIRKPFNTLCVDQKRLFNVKKSTLKWQYSRCYLIYYC